jgi:IPT/TIG domain-containing protein
MRTPTEKDDALLRPPAQARATVAGLSRALTCVLLIAPLLALFAVVSAPGAVQASGRGHAITVAPDNGPAGTNVTVTGAAFPSNSDVTIGYGSGGCDSGVTTISGATGKTDANGGLKVSFGWPSTPAGEYKVCVTVGGATYPSDNTFTATSPNAPTITVTSPVAAGAQVTVTGSNFLLNGAQTADVSYGPQGSNGCATSVATGVAITNGSFTATFNAPFVTQTTQYTVTAVTPDGSCGGTPTLSAQATLTVNGATPTATFTPSPTATTGGTGGTTSGGGTAGLTWPPTWPPSGAWSVVYCLVGLLLLLLLLLLVLLFARNRRQDEPVTIQERDNVTVQSSGSAGAAGGAGAVQRNIEAVDPRTGRRTVIAQDEYTFEEVPDDQPPA